MRVLRVLRESGGLSERVPVEPGIPPPCFTPKADHMVRRLPRESFFTLKQNYSVKSIVTSTTGPALEAPAMPSKPSPLHALRSEVLARDARGMTMAALADWAANTLGRPITHRQVSHFLYRYRPGATGAVEPQRKRGKKPIEPVSETPAEALPPTGQNLQRAIDLLLHVMADPEVRDEDRVELADRVLELDMELENRRLAAMTKSRKRQAAVGSKTT